MRRCHRCDRHVFEASTRCPFCGAAHRVVASPGPVLGVLVGLSLASCSDRPANDEGTSAGTTAGASTTTANTTSDGMTGPLTATADGTSTTVGPATTAMTATATTDGTTSGSTTSGGTSSSGTTTGSSEDTFPLPPYAGAFPDDDESASTTE
jgi:hypothetical protein